MGIVEFPFLNFIQCVDGSSHNTGAFHRHVSVEVMLYFISFTCICYCVTFIMSRP